MFRPAEIVTKKEPNRHYHAITSVNPRDPNVKKHRLAQLISKEEHRKNKLISVGAQKVFLEVLTQTTPDYYACSKGLGIPPKEGQ